MKAFKGCVNRECKAYKTRVSYKEKFEYCPHCGEKLEYVCANCWKVLEQNVQRLCVGCSVEKEEKKEQKKEKVINAGKAIVSVAPVIWKQKDKIVDFTKKAVNVIKKK